MAVSSPAQVMVAAHGQGFSVDDRGEGLKASREEVRFASSGLVSHYRIDTYTTPLGLLVENSGAVLSLLVGLLAGMLLSLPADQSTKVQNNGARGKASRQKDSV